MYNQLELINDSMESYHFKDETSVTFLSASGQDFVSSQWSDTFCPTEMR